MQASISGVTSLDVNNQNINNLTGIEDFIGLIFLECQENQINSLNVSTLSLLKTFYCFDNQLSLLDVSSNLDLENLHCYENQITNIDLSQNTQLYDLQLGENQLNSLDITNNLNLWRLLCNDNQLNSLDVTNNAQLQILRCQGNNLSTLNTSNCTQLVYLDFAFQQISSIDVSQNVALTTFYSNDNQLSTLNLSTCSLLTKVNCSSNLLTEFTIKNGNNINFTEFVAHNNPNLNCISVDDPAWSTANWTNIDSHTIFMDDCASYVALDADFSADATTICQGNSVTFTDLSVGTSSINSWSWDFGNGNTSTLQNPVHNFETAGIFSVSLTVNGSDTEIKIITVNSLPFIDLGPDTILICDGASQIIDAGTGLAFYLWSDGSTAQTLTVNTAGTYTVTGTDANPANGCTASDSMVIDILNVDIAQNDTTICEGDSLVFSVNSSRGNLLSGNNQLAIGDIYQGGIIFYLDGNGGGLVAAPTDQSSGSEFGCKGILISGADGTSIGSGFQNTQDIVNASCSPSTLSSSLAAEICGSLLLGGYSDWFLPSRDEINLVWQNLADSDGNGVNTGQSDPNNIGGFVNSYYWSSTESDNNNAWIQSFINGSWGGGNSKASSHKVRAIRAFTLNTPNYIYTWSPGGETTPSITVKPSSTTNYTVDVTSGSTTCQSDVTISVNQRDIVTIDSTACDSIMWDRNWLVSTGTYFDTLQNLAGCDSIITLNLTINPSPVFSFTQDTLTACNVDSILVDAGAGYNFYAWSNGQNTQQIYTANSGTCSVTVTDDNGCTDSDDVLVDILNVDIVQNDTSICEGESIALEATSNILAFNVTQSMLLVPSEYATIQLAIDAATNGDTVYVSNGTYVENITMQNKNIAIIGQSKDSVIIDGQSLRCFDVSGCSLILNNLTINNGSYGIISGSSSFNIDNCIFSNHDTTATHLWSTSSVIKHSLYKYNNKQTRINGSVSFTGCTFFDEKLIDLYSCSTTIDNCLINGWIYHRYSKPLIIRNTTIFRSNGGELSLVEGGYVTIENSIFGSSSHNIGCWSNSSSF